MEGENDQNETPEHLELPCSTPGGQRNGEVKESSNKASVAKKAIDKCSFDERLIACLWVWTDKSYCLKGGSTISFHFVKRGSQSFTLSIFHG